MPRAPRARFFIGGLGCWLDGNTCVGIQRAETLADALEGNITEWAGLSTAAPILGGTQTRMPADPFHWEDQTLYLGETATPVATLATAKILHTCHQMYLAFGGRLCANNT